MRILKYFHRCALTFVLVTAMAACEDSVRQAPSVRSAVPPMLMTDAEPVFDSTFRVTFDDHAAFIARFSRLARLGTAWGTLLYSPRSAKVVDRLRSELPESHPLHLVNDFASDDRVLVLWTSPSGERFFVVFTEGMSGDPGFYLADASRGRETSGLWGEVLVLPDSGALYMFQRTNSDFPRTKRIDVRNGEFVELDTTRFSFELRTVALGSLLLRRSTEDSTVIAQIAPGDSVIVYEAFTGPREGYLIRTVTGASGVVRMPSQQCPYSLIRRICYLGD